MKRLFLCRHAKSSWKDSTLADIDRPLNKRGKKDAPVMGARLAMRGFGPDLILASPAKRALATARQLAKHVDYPKKNIIIKNELYGATPDTQMHIIRNVYDDLTSVYIVGHNPETTLLANYLGGLDIYNVPTCGIVLLEFDVESWGKIDRGEGKLILFDYPKRIEDEAGL